MSRNIKKLFIISLVAAFLLPYQALAEPYLAWDPSSGTVTGYRIYYGQSSGVYPSNKEVGNVTQYSLSGLGLEENKTYHFVVRAYNDVGESGNSNEVSWSVPDTTAPLPPQGVAAQ